VAAIKWGNETCNEIGVKPPMTSKWGFDEYDIDEIKG
jgi:hypothetical protein